MPIPAIDPNKTGIMLIDAQPFFWDSMHGAQEPVLLRAERLMMLADWLGIPFIATFEHPVETKGWLPERLEKVFPSHGLRFVKRTFNCCTEASINEALTRSQISQIVVAGAETDVCVLQSSLGLLRMGLGVFLLEDCVFTSEHHARPALERMYRAGVVPCTLKIFFYELMRTVEKEALPAQWKARAESFAEYFQLESLPAFEPAT